MVIMTRGGTSSSHFKPTATTARALCFGLLLFALFHGSSEAFLNKNKKKVKPLDLPPSPDLQDKEVIAETRRLFSALVTAISNGNSVPLPATKYPEKVDIGVFGIFVMLCLAFNWGVRLVVVEPVAKVLLHGPPENSCSAAKLQIKCQKFAQAFMEMIFYGAFSIFGYILVMSQDWFWPSSKWWDGFAETDATGRSLHSYMTDALAGYYILYAARYLQGAVSVCLEHKRKDFVEMQIHHLVTFLLVVISYAYGWNRVGAVIMLNFDPADVPLHTAKMLKYLGERRCTKAENAFALLADVFFVLFMILFFGTRVVLHGYICWSAHIEATRYFPKFAAEWTCVALLYMLLCLQLYWGHLIVKVLVKLALTGHVEDNRSDDEEEVPKENKEAIARKKAQ